MVYSGLIWWQDNKDADMMKKVYFVFNPQIYSIENLTKANDLIRYCINLWNKHGIYDEKERYFVENLERQYYNNTRRLYHYNKFLSGKILKLSKKIEKLSLL